MPVKSNRMGQSLSCRALLSCRPVGRDIPADSVFLVAREMVGTAHPGRAEFVSIVRKPPSDKELSCWSVVNKSFGDLGILFDAQRGWLYDCGITIRLRPQLVGCWQESGAEAMTRNKANLAGRVGSGPSRPLVETQNLASLRRPYGRGPTVQNKANSVGAGMSGKLWLGTELSEKDVDFASAKTKPICPDGPAGQLCRASVPARIGVSCGEARPTKRCPAALPNTGLAVQNKANLGRAKANPSGW
jgi:hypothetical protein